MPKVPPYEAADRGNAKYHSERYDSLLEDTDLALSDRVACSLLAVVWSCGYTGVHDMPAAKKPLEFTIHQSTSLSQRTVPITAEMLRALTKDEEQKVRAGNKNVAIKVKNTETAGTDAHWLRDRQLRQLEIQLDCVAAAFVQNTWYFAANNLVIIASDVEVAMAEIDGMRLNYLVVRDDTPYLHAEMKILKHLRNAGIPLNGVNMGVSKPCCPQCKAELEREKVAYTSYHNGKAEAGHWVPPF
jgi:hypothetical protein